ncbi:unnamed protein product [Closterium sp. Naga37s-1]|nr:unnamed protein product [Closterium sp. Naga37s-1]
MARVGGTGGNGVNGRKGGMGKGLRARVGGRKEGGGGGRGERGEEGEGMEGGEEGAWTLFWTMETGGVLNEVHHLSPSLPPTPLLSTPLYSSLLLSTPLYTSLHLSTPLYTSLHLSNPLYSSLLLSYPPPISFLDGGDWRSAERGASFLLLSCPGNLSKLLVTFAGSGLESHPLFLSPLQIPLSSLLLPPANPPNTHKRVEERDAVRAGMAGSRGWSHNSLRSREDLEPPSSPFLLPPSPLTHTGGWEERDAVRAGMAGSRGWTHEYLPLVKPAFQSQVRPWGGIRVNPLTRVVEWIAFLTHFNTQQAWGTAASGLRSTSLL